MPRNIYDGLIYEIEQEFVFGGTLIDVGGGVSLKNAVLAQSGMTVHVIDLFSTYFSNAPSGSYDISRLFDHIVDCGVHMIEADITAFDLASEFENSSIDVVSMLHVLEHMHSFPMRLLTHGVSLLRPGGIFITDNVLWSGRIFDKNPNKTTKAVLEFNRKLFSADGILSSIIPIRDGLGMAVKL